MDADIAAQYDKIYQYCYFHVHDRDRAEDLTQETFLRYLKRRGSDDTPSPSCPDHALASGTFPPGKQLAYLYTIARNLCTDYFRINGREQPVAGEQFDRMHEADGLRYSPMDMLAESVALREAVDALPDELREVIALRFVLEEPAASVAKLLGMSRFAVYRREKEALGLLRERLDR